jgi:hypothetical protein
MVPDILPALRMAQERNKFGSIETKESETKGDIPT